jgi:GTPase Era involved in 16S rRNA processing
MENACLPRPRSDSEPAGARSGVPLQGFLEDEKRDRTDRTGRRPVGKRLKRMAGHALPDVEKEEENLLEEGGGFGERDSERERIADTLTAMSDELMAVAKSSAGHENLLEIFREGLKKINALRDSLTEPFKIAVVGAQGTGKSTIINLLLGEPIMISHYDETEGSIIKLVHTEDSERERKASIKYFTDRDGVYREEFISRDEFYRLINLSTNAKLKTDAIYRDSIAFFEIYSRNPLLRAIQFINTPGLNTVTADFLQKVKHLFIEADVILWMNKRNQILDSFNTKLMPQIHRDNRNIIGILGFADDLYQSDHVNGVRDVLKEFFEETEKKMLLRKESGGKQRVCFFLYNGLAAESALGMKPDRFISEANDVLPGEEASLRMLWNYLNHGFPFVDEDTALMEDFSLWHEHNRGGLTQKIEVEVFDKDHFVEWLRSNRFIQKKDRGYGLTEKGKTLLLKSSMLPTIQDFAQEVIFDRALQAKISRVKEGVNRLYGPGNILSVIKKKKGDYQEIIEEEDRDFARAQKEMVALKETFGFRYREWYVGRIQRYAGQMSRNLVKRILEEMGKRISKKDLWKEFLKQMTPQIFRGDDEGPVMTEISRIIEAEFEALAEAKTERIIAEAVEEVRNIITEPSMGSVRERRVQNRELRTGKRRPDSLEVKYGIKKVRFNDAELNEVMKKLMDKLGKMMGTLIKKMAASGMRKKGMAKFKKLFVKVFRKVSSKLIMDYAKQQAEIAPAKGMPILGWLLIIKDLIELGLMLNEMLDELKGKLENAVKENEDDFFDHFRKVLEPAYLEVQTTIFEGLEESFQPKNKEAEAASKGVGLCDRAIRIFETYRPHVETIPAPPPIPLSGRYDSKSNGERGGGHIYEMN